MASPTVALLQTRIFHNKYDVEAWEQVVEELARDVMSVPPARRNPAAVEGLLDALRGVVGIFPTASKHWKMYADLEMDRGNLDAAKNIFSKCLLACLNVDLWKSYLRYIDITNQTKGDTGAQEVVRAYEFSLDKLGSDSACGVLWHDFIAYLSNIRVGTARFALIFPQQMPGQEHSARAAKLRTHYQRALQVPSAHLDILWRDYERFERTCAGPGRSNPASARFIDDMRPRFQSSRMAWMNRKRYLDAIDTTALPHLPGHSPPSADFDHQRKLWLDFLAFEMKNEQGLEQKALQARVNLSYQQALYVLRHCPEVWHQWAFLWVHDDISEGVTHAMATLQQARVALPDCVMLSFALADLHEASGHVDRARSVYEELAKRMEEEDTDPASSLPAEPGSVVWMQFMRFAKRNGRTAGQGQTDARRVFMRARKWEKCTWHVFVCHALMEWQLQRQLQPDQLASSVTIVKRIFELGLLKPHIQAAPGYIETFADWLVSTSGDIENARAHFEGALAEDSGQANPEMWDAFLRFEHCHGTLQEVIALEARRGQAVATRRIQLPPHDSFQLMQRRYVVQGLWGCTEEQREYLAHVLSPSRGSPLPSAKRLAGVLGDADVPPSVALFMSKLATLEQDQPVPDVDLVVDIILRANLDAVPGAASDAGGTANVGDKRSADAATLSPHPGTLSPMYTDVYRMRQKQRIEST